MCVCAHKHGEAKAKTEVFSSAVNFLRHSLSLSWLAFADLTHASVLWEEGSLVEKMPPPGKPVQHFLDS